LLNIGFLLRMEFPKQPGVLKFRSFYHIIVCAILFILVVNIRWRILYDFCFLITDCDQVLLWDAANDMHKGIFHEPCFYGQSYNPLVEPLFAQPFILLGMPLRYAMPLVSWIFGFIPYLLFAWAFIRQKKYISLAFTFAYLLWLPLEFHAIDSMPRGYVPACAFASIGIYFAMFTNRNSRFFWFGFLSIIAITVSQNCVFLIVPAGIYLWLYNIKNLKFYLHVIAGLLVALPLPLYIYWFYSTHPANIVHLIEYTFGFDTFKDTISEIQVYFNFLTPDVKNKLLVITLGYVLFAVACFAKRNVKAGIAILAGLAMLFFSFWFDKVEDGTDSLFFSSVRIFLGVPLALILFCYWTESSFKIKSYKGTLQFLVLTFLLVAGIICSSERNRYFQAKLYKPSSDTDVVSGKRVDSVVGYCNHLKVLCNDNHSSLVILENLQVAANYMCPALNYPFETLRPSYERRTWDMKQEDTTTRSNFIYFPLYPDSFLMALPSRLDFRQTKDPKGFLINTHGQKVFAILKELKVVIRTH